MTVRACDSCGTTYEAKRSSSKYCSDRCRRRAHEGSLPAVVVPFVPPALVVGGIASATQRELEGAEMLDTSLGQKAMFLAMHLDNMSNDTGSSVAAVVREHSAVMVRALELGKVEADPLDELAIRRRERRARA